MVSNPRSPPSQDAITTVLPKPYTRPFLNYLSSAINARFGHTAQSENLELFKYSKLSGPRQVRLMVLHPAILFESPLKCDLLCVELGTVPYEALSYVWGIDDFRHVLLCRGQTLYISSNLYRALHFLRRKSQKRLLWVDAVCINQNDLAEKETQIPLMRDIYSQAMRSLIWLGEANSDILAVFWTLRIMYPLWIFQGSLEKLMPIHDWLYHQKRVQLTSRGHVSSLDNMIGDLIERAWFTRTWTLQELLLNDSSVFICGRHTVPAQILAGNTRQMVPWVIHNPGSILYDNWRFQGLVLLRYFQDSSYCKNEVDALQFMMVVETASTSNPKDKVIGIQAILQRIEMTLPELSYGMSRELLYMTLAECWMRHWGTLRLLGLKNPSAASNVLPSWVIDWNCYSGREQEIVSNAYTRLVYLQCRDSASGMKISASRRSPLPEDTFSVVYTTGQLLLRGILVSTVKVHVGPSGVTHRYLCPEDIEDDVDRQRLAMWAKNTRTVLLWAQFLATALCASDSSNDTMSCVAAVFNVGPQALITSRYQSNGLESDMKCMSVLTRSLDLSDPELARVLKGHRILDSKLWRAISLRVETETLFTTVDGRIGICHAASITQGDVVVLVAGSDFPLMLRRYHDSSCNEFTFLGPAVLSTQPSAVAHLEERWNRAELDRPWSQRLLKPMLPGQYRGEERFSNNLYVLSSKQHAKISALMRGEEWPLHIDVNSMTKFMLI